MADLKRRKRKRITHEGREQLVVEVEANPLLHHGRFAGPEGKRKLKLLWEEVTEKLNETNKQKTVEEWKICWSNLVRRVREKKAAEYAASRRARNLSLPPPLTELEERVYAIVGWEMAEGCKGRLADDFEEIEVLPVFSPLTSQAPAPPSPAPSSQMKFSPPHSPPPTVKRKPIDDTATSSTDPLAVMVTHNETMADVALALRENAVAVERAGATLAAAVERAGATLAAAVQAIAEALKHK